MENSEKPKQPELLSFDFNQDSTCFSVGTTKDYRIFSTDPLKLRVKHSMESEIGEVGMVEMLFRTNIFVIVGTDNNSDVKSNKLVIWDDKEKKQITTYKYTTPILKVKLRKDKFFFVTMDTIHVVSCPDFQPIDKIKTGENPRGIIAITTDQNICLLAYPDIEKGHVRIKNFNSDSITTKQIKSHENALAFLAMTKDGSYLATASEQGTLIRIYDPISSDLLQEVRRGSEKADIHYISFNQNNTMFACTSDKGTIHIFSLSTAIKAKNNGELPPGIIENKKSSLKFLPGSYFDNEFSFAKVRIEEPNSLCAFGAVDTIIIITKSGKLYKAEIDVKNGGECKIIGEENYMNLNKD